MKVANNHEFNKWWSRFKSDSKIKDCFHYDHQSCNGNIINAHSLQRNGVLNQLESDYRGSQVVYSFAKPVFNDIFQIIGFQPLGKKQASTFTGFCQFHDKELFRKVEENEIDLDNDEHCFLLSYRSFAKEFHTKTEVNQGYKVNEMYNRSQYRSMQHSLVAGSELAIRDNSYVKFRLNKMLANEEFNGLHYFAYSLDYIVPIACAAAITPRFSYRGAILNKPQDINVMYENIIVTMLPTQSGNTHILFSWLPEHKKSQRFIDELEDLEDKQLEIAITSILIGEIENTFFSPLLWKRMDTKKQKQFLSELEQTTTDKQGLQTKFFKSKLNLLNARYRLLK